MKCLAVNAANSELSVALVAGQECLHLFKTKETRDQGNILLGHIQQALTAGGLGFADLDVLGVVTGPGSFTGIRLALATMRGLALAAQKPVVGISSFDLFSVTGRGSHVIALESWREELYWRLDDGRGGCLIEPVNETPDDFMRRAAAYLTGPVVVSGDAADKIRTRIPGAVLSENMPTAADAARLVIKKMTDHPSIAQERPVPFYLREADVTLPGKR